MADTRPAALDVLDLGAEGVGLLNAPEWTDGDRNSKTLFKADTLRVMLTALRAGAVLRNDDPDETVAVQGLQGEVEVRTGGHHAPLRAGQLACLSRGYAWELEAATDSLVVLTVGRQPDPAGVAQD